MGIPQPYRRPLGAAARDEVIRRNIKCRSLHLVRQYLYGERPPAKATDPPCAFCFVAEAAKKGGKGKSRKSGTLYHPVEKCWTGVRSQNLCFKCFAPPHSSTGGGRCP